MSRRLPKPATSRAPATTATMVTVSRRVIPSPQSVPHTPDGGEGQGVAEFLAQLAYVDVDGALVAVPPRAPDPVEDLLAAERQPAVLGQEVQEIELARRQRHNLAIHSRLAAPGVDLHAADEDDVGSVPRRAVDPAQDGLDARHEL